jgi:electron transfer flavoprotein alpha subunit
VTPDIVVVTWGDDSADATRALLTLAQRLTAGGSGEARWLTIGDPPERAAEIASACGTANVDQLADGRLRSFGTDRYVHAIAEYAAARAPRLILMQQTFDARVVAPRLAERLGGGCVMNAIDVAISEGSISVTASVFGGDMRAVYTLAGGSTNIVAVMPGSSLPPLSQPAGESVSLHNVAVDLRETEERIRVVAPAHAEGPRIEDAEIVVAGGRGLGAAANFRLIEDLAAALGGIAAASRPIVDDGWADSARQVGLTGKSVRPALYIAVGVSGASQHMAGCASAKTIVAINRDRDAAIFRYARYGIVGDCMEVVPELIRAVSDS